MNEILKNIITRRSIRAFTNQPINQQDLEMILQAGVYAPSGNNRQSWQFTVLKHPAAIQRLAKAMGKELGNPNYNMYAPTTAILLSNDRENTNGLADCSCALENIFLMANALGIGSCWINQLKSICDQPEIRVLLNEYGVPENHIVWGVAALGYAQSVPEAKPRLDVIKYVE